MRRTMKHIAPYQIFFPLGLFYGILGTVLWPLFAFTQKNYPGPQHIHLMVLGFLLCFAVGFLMTAVPRFTGSTGARPWEVIVALILSMGPLSVFVSTVDMNLIVHSFALGVFFFLLYFFISRRLEGKFSLPENFYWIPLGLFFGVSGAGLYLAQSFGSLPIFFSKLAPPLLHQSMMLAFIVGVGMRLVSALLGWGPQPTVQITRKKDAVVSAHALSIFLMLVFVTGLVVEALDFTVLGRGLRAFVVTFVAIKNWKIYRSPHIKGYLPRALWFAVWGLVLGLWTYALLPQWGVHGLHLALVFGYSWMVLVVASRVTLAHGGYDLSLEFNSKAILGTGIFMVLAAATRVIAPLVGSGYAHHLAYASLMWIVAVSIWSASFLPRILLLKKS